MPLACGFGDRKVMELNAQQQLGQAGRHRCPQRRLLAGGEPRNAGAQGYERRVLPKAVSERSF